MHEVTCKSLPSTLGQHDSWLFNVSPICNFMFRYIVPHHKFTLVERERL